jgi:hypothetical protein
VERALLRILIMPHHFDIPKIKLPKGERTLSSEIILERCGGKMWDELKKWLEEKASDEGWDQEWDNAIAATLNKMKEIEKQYGIDYTE